MELSDLKKGQMVWLVMNGIRQVKLIVVNCDNDPVKCRFPNGHLEDVYIDELEPV